MKEDERDVRPLTAPGTASRDDSASHDELLARLERLESLLHAIYGVLVTRLPAALPPEPERSAEPERPVEPIHPMAPPHDPTPARPPRRRTRVEWFFKNLSTPRFGVLRQYVPRPIHFGPPRRQREPASSALRVSIVTPTRNYGHFLERTMKSVLDQDYTNVEYVVQDGGSTDNSVELLEQYADRLAHWESVPDRGQTHALNLGFAHTTGDIMAYLNSDDMLLPGAARYVATYFAEHPDVDVVYGHRILIDEYDMEVGRWVIPPHDNTAILWIDPVPQETLFWRRSIWEKVGGRVDESFHFAMDWDLILRFRTAGAKFVRVPRFLGAFRVHPNQKTLTWSDEFGMPESDRLRERYLGETFGWDAIHRRVRPYLLRHLLYHYLHRLGVFRYKL